MDLSRFRVDDTTRYAAAYATTAKNRHMTRVRITIELDGACMNRL